MWVTLFSFYMEFNATFYYNDLELRLVHGRSRIAVAELFLF